MLRATASILLISVITGVLVVGAATHPDARVFIHPAEFEKQQAVWMSACSKQNGRETLGVVIQMIKALAPHVRIQLMVAGQSL
ncbi:MAG TPA: hypothetical protein VGI85_09765 [Chthoniobacterales bacterium]|jgi:agmatine/peptidylarginine deiminase